ncbi:MAG: CRTAC1 family protein, partial [Verrucomicrobiales bacterium]|nr:CRTAC1 family protein [Verrucomicrobiales bacterium]
ADFDADGRLDLLLIGMPSPTVDRLEHLGTVRPGSTQDPRRRTAMTRGNRLYLARADGGFHDGGELGQSIARSGWSWGCAAADFDNDGFPDVAIGNGMESKATVRDYESEYWLHDQHVGTSEEDPVTYLYYKSKIARTRGSGWSYGGYEKNRLYLNRSGRRFFEAGHLLGVALEQDTRNVLSEDMDADGKPDLVVVSFEKWPEPKPTLRIFGNGLADTGRWIGFRLPGARPGTRVTIRHGGRVQTRQIVAGDSYRSQHSEVVHFGLGTSEGVDEAVLEGPGNKKRALAGLASNRYYRIAEGGFGPISGTE